MTRDPYEILGLPLGATESEVKAAYRRLARETHPDLHPGDPSAERRFKEVASAYEVLMDPAAREALGRHARGELPPAFLDDVASAVERAQTWIEVVVLPEILRGWRGGGAEAATRFLGGLASLEPPRTFDAPSWWARRRADRVARRVQVWIERWPGPEASSLGRGPHGHVIRVNPDPLWHAGVRSSVDVDAVVMRLLLARYAQVVALRARGARLASLDGDADLVRARAHDDEVIRGRWVTAAVWVFVFGLLAVMMVDGYTSGRP